jgi:hypothetical protein
MELYYENMRKIEHNYGARSYTKLVLNILRWHEENYLHLYIIKDLVQKKNSKYFKRILEYFKLSWDMSKDFKLIWDVSRNLFGQVFNYIMNVQWMRTKTRHTWMNSIHDDVGNVLDVMLVMIMVMLTMMLEMMLTMSFMINNIYDFKIPRLCNMLCFLISP